ncbi:MAG: hypothetical protein ACREKB_10320 [Candidatus Rokuibacteriota bacterium]
MRCLQTLTLSVVLTLAAVAPLAAQPRETASRIWTQVNGRVERIDGARLILKADSGQRLRVDLSHMSTDDRRELAPGGLATLIGYAGARSDEFVARFVPVDRGDAAAASPRTEPAEDQVWRIVQGRVAGAEGTTLLLRTDEGAAVTVDMAPVDERVRGALTANERVTVIGFSRGAAGRFEARFIHRDTAAGLSRAPATRS